MDEWLSPLNPFNSMKSLVWADRYEALAKGEIPQPVSITIDPTNRCNLSCEWCLVAGTRILMADLTWRPIEEICEGDYVISATGKSEYGGRRLVPVMVTHIFRRMTNTLVNIKTDVNEITLTPNHSMLKGISHYRRWWLRAENFKVGDHIYGFPYASAPNSKEYERGWLCGVADGDGCFWTERQDKTPQHRFYIAMKDTEAIDTFALRASKAGWHLDRFKHKSGIHDLIMDALRMVRTHDVQAFNKWLYIDGNNDYSLGYLAGIFDAEGSHSANIIRIAQYNSVIKERIKEHLGIVGYKYMEESDGIRLLGTIVDKLNFFLRTRPVIFRKVQPIFNHRLVSSLEVTETRHFKTNEDVYNLETETGNYIAEGFLVHNCHYAAWRSENPAHADYEALLQLAEDIVDWHKEGGPVAVCIAGGGEPMIHAAFPEVVRTLVQGGLQIGVITNGVNLTKDNLDALLLCRWVGFSVDAGFPTSYARMKGAAPNTFEKVLDNIRHLSSCDPRPSIGFKFLLQPNTINELYKAAWLAKDIGADDFHARPMYVPELIWSDEDIEGIKQAIIILREALEDDTFHIYGVTHKFNPNFSRKLPEKCEVTPLAGLTFCADGCCYICCDKRGDNDAHIASWDNIRKFWGSAEHKLMLHTLNTSGCHRRCTFNAYQEILDKVFREDRMCRAFI